MDEDPDVRDLLNEYLPEQGNAVVRGLHTRGEADVGQGGGNR